MIHLDLASFSLAAVVIGAPVIAVLRVRHRRDARDHAVLRDAGLYRGPVAGRTGEVRER